MMIKPTVSLVAVTPNAEDVIAHATRTCYASSHLSTPERDARLIRDCIANGHESVLEHASATFEIVGSRVLTHEMVRHRIAAYSQRSQRYVKEGTPSYFQPPEIQGNERATELYQAAMENAWKSYAGLIAAGINKQIARYVLPNACLTTIVATWNFREIRHVVRLRASKRAQPEFQEVARGVLGLVLPVAPNVFGDLAGLLEGRTEEA